MYVESSNVARRTQRGSRNNEADLAGDNLVTLLAWPFFSFATFRRHTSRKIM